MRSGEVAHAAGVNQQTLRYYERRGLLAEPLRTPGGHRLYPAEAVTVVRVIKAAQRLGFSLEEVAGLIQTGLCGRSKHGSGLREQAAAKLAEVEAKIADLSVIADTLRAALAAGCADLVECARHPDCPLPLDAADAADPPGGRPGQYSSLAM
jgi:DNA-binding transcriptional MerR regulator